MNKKYKQTHEWNLVNLVKKKKESNEMTRFIRVYNVIIYNYPDDHIRHFINSLIVYCEIRYSGITTV